METSKKVNIEKLVERQIRYWETQAKHRQGEETAPRIEEDLFPYIAISRQVGSGGNEIGAALADRLGYVYYDREIVDYIAERAHVRVAAVKSLGETWYNAIQDWIAGAIDSGYCGFDTYVRHLIQVTTALAGHGPAVFMGRGVGFFLPPHRGIHIRVTAPVEQRIQYAMTHYGLPDVEARKLVVNSDASQESFMRTYFKRVPSDPLNYDLTINTGQVSVKEAVELCVVLHRSRFGGETRKDSRVVPVEARS